jgi:tetratricopeptide (TPR) repeat protein
MIRPVKNANALVAKARECSDDSYALTLLLEAIQLDPASFEPFEELGKCYLRLGELGRAEEALRIALDFDDDGWVHLYLGNVQYRHNEYEAAEGEYNLAAAVLTDEPAPLWCIGDVRRAAGDLAGAEEHYRRAVCLDADDASSLARLGRFLVETERSCEGEPFLREALACDPANRYAAKWAMVYLHD